MNKTILVIGSGKYQLSALKKIKKLRYYLIAVDGDKNSPGKEIADKFLNIDIKDTKKILLALQKEKIDIDYCMCFATELALRTVAQINKAFNLPGLTKQMVDIATNKFLQREIQKEIGLPYPKFFVSHKGDNILQKARKTKVAYPVIVKPVDNSGSRGVYISYNEKDLLRNSRQSIKFSSFDQNIVVEEFIPGIEFTIESLINNNHIYHLAISEKRKPVNNFTVSTELFYNSPLVERLRPKIESQLTKFFKKCNFNNTVTHTEMLYSFKDHLLYIVETTVRAGGFGIFDKITPKVSGLDVVSLTISSLMGEKASIPVIQQNSCVLRFFTGNKGTVKNISISNDIIKNVKDSEYGLFVKEGDVVGELKDDGSRLGYILAFGQNWKQAFERANQIEYAVKFEICP